MKPTNFVFNNNFNSNNNNFIKKSILLLFTLLLIFIIIMTLGYSLNNKILLQTESISVPYINKKLNGYSILHISDFNSNEALILKNDIVKLLKEKSFNAVCFTGNMIGDNDNLKAIKLLISQIKQINQNANIYYLPGDYDPSPTNYENNEQIYTNCILELQKLGVIYLDRPYYEQYGKDKIWFSPEYLYSIDPVVTLNAMTSEIERLESSSDLFNPHNANIYKSLSYQSRIMESTIDAQKIAGPNDIQILLSSLPLNSNSISDSIEFSNKDSNFSMRKATLILAGSLVGGQWCLPGSQPIYVPGYGLFPNKSEIYGKSRILTVNQYISPGLSCSPLYPYPKIRIYTSPTITIIKLKNTY